jgi:hypothetical protein
MNSLDESVPAVDAKSAVKADPAAATTRAVTPEGKNGTPKEIKAATPDPNAEPSPEQLEIDIEGIRENLGGLISELDHRRHRLNPMRIVRSNQFAFAAGGVLVVGLCVGGIAWRVSRKRRAASAFGAGKKFSEATRAKLRQLLLGDADASVAARQARPNVTMKLLTAAGTAVAAVAARRLAEGAFARARAKTTPPRSW